MCRVPYAICMELINFTEIQKDKIGGKRRKSTRFLRYNNKKNNVIKIYKINL